MQTSRTMIRMLIEARNEMVTRYEIEDLPLMRSMKRGVLPKYQFAVSWNALIANPPFHNMNPRSRFYA